MHAVKSNQTSRNTQEIKKNEQIAWINIIEKIKPENIKRKTEQLDSIEAKETENRKHNLALKWRRKLF